MQRLALQMYNYTNSQAPSMLPPPPPPPPPSFFDIGYASPPPPGSSYHQPSEPSMPNTPPAPPVSPYYRPSMSYTPDSPPLSQRRDNFDDDTIDVNDGPEYFDIMNLRRSDEENRRVLHTSVSRADLEAHNTVEQARIAIENRREAEENEMNESIEVINEVNMEVDVSTNVNDIDYDDNTNVADDEIEASTDSADDEVVYIGTYQREAAEGLVQLSGQRPRTSPGAPPPTPEPLPPGFNALAHTAQQTPPTSQRRPPTPRTPRPFPRLSRSIARHEQIRLEQQRAIAAQLPRPLCGICKDDLLTKSPMTLPCNHVFCSECIREMIRYQPSCPVCREMVPSIDWCDFVFFP